jgi:hypothetical protein
MENMTDKNNFFRFVSFPYAFPSFIRTGFLSFETNTMRRKRVTFVLVGIHEFLFAKNKL